MQRLRVHISLNTLLFLGSVLTASPALAQQEPEAPEGEQSVDERFQAEADEASARYAEKDYDGAIAAFERAYALKPKSNILYNLGRIHEKKGDFEGSIRYFERFVNEPDIELSAREDALARIKALQEVLALRQKSQQGSAQNTPPPSDVEAPLANTGDPSGDASVVVPLTPGRQREFRVVHGALIGVGVAGVATGVVFSQLARQSYETTQDTNDLEALRDARERGPRQALIADVAVAGGAALIATGALLYLFSDARDTSPGVTLAPALSPGFSGAQLSLTF